MNITSPDDKAFMHCIDFMDFRIRKRIADRVHLSIMGKKQEIRLVDNLAFDSYRKKMSVISFWVINYYRVQKEANFPARH